MESDLTVVDVILRLVDSGMDLAIKGRDRSPMSGTEVLQLTVKTDTGRPSVIVISQVISGSSMM